MKQNERLTDARIASGYRTASEAAKALGISVATYIAHENGNRGLTVKSAERYANQFNVRSGWLLTGEEPRHFTTDWNKEWSEMETSSPTPEEWGTFEPGKPYKGSLFKELPEIEPWTDEPDRSVYEVVSEWLFPNDFVQQTLQCAPRNIFLMKVADDAMAPSFASGDRAIVDTAQNTFRGEGVYALRDDDGNIALRVITKAIVNAPKEGNIGVSTTRPGQTYFTTLSSLSIMGRAVGKIGRI